MKILVFLISGQITGLHGYKMIQVEPGVFNMGSPDIEVGRSDDEQSHQVNIDYSFELGSSEVTQAFYEYVMEANPSTDKYQGINLIGPLLPVQSVTWFEAIEFCNKLSQMEGLDPAYQLAENSVIWDKTSNGYRLPTEEEWEFAAKAGLETTFPGTDNLDSLCLHANFADISASKRLNQEYEAPCDDTLPVVSACGLLLPNQWGFFDMAGNVWEWTWTLYEDNSERRVIKGGSFLTNAEEVRCSNRHSASPASRNSTYGFRIAKGSILKTNSGDSAR